MLTIYRRHQAPCKHSSRRYRNCKCPIWVQGSLRGGAVYATKNLERMRAFFRFCEQAGWTKGNPAAPVKAPKVKISPTLPFSTAEMGRILDACDRYPGNADRMKAFV